MLGIVATVLAQLFTLLSSLPYPDLDPVAFRLGEKLAVRWYSLAYIIGLLSGWFIAARMARAVDTPYDRETINEFPTWVLVGIVGGGRIGYVLFYNLAFYLDHPERILSVWDGGMSFHGGFLGVILAAFIFARIKKLPFLSVTDVICLVAPIGLMLGRLANFVNGELYGRVTDSKMGMIFPDGGPYPRHPSQLYEAVLEGALLLTAMWVARAKTRGKVGYGFLSGVFVVGYGIARTVSEVFREPDAQLGYLFGVGVTMGQLLSIPMVIAGVLIARAAVVRGPPPAQQAADAKAAKQGEADQGESTPGVDGSTAADDTASSPSATRESDGDAAATEQDGDDSDSDNDNDDRQETSSPSTDP